MPTQGKLFELPTPEASSSPNALSAPACRFRLVLERDPEWTYEALASCRIPGDAARILRRVLDGEYHTIAAIGTIRSAPVDPRAIFVPALMANAASLILFHNHPSGDPTPSNEDIAVTRQLAEAGQLFGLGVVDHLIIGEGPRYASLRERGVRFRECLGALYLDGRHRAIGRWQGPREKPRGPFHPCASTGSILQLTAQTPAPTTGC